MRTIFSSIVWITLAVPGWSQTGDARGGTEANLASSTVPEVSLFPDRDQTSVDSGKKTGLARRPRMAGSSTGYIDNAIVGSQIRVRFDADFTFNNPDRAEFLYGKCGCYGGSPGPKPGIAKSVNLQEVRLDLEYAPTGRFSFFAEVPERSIQFTTIPNTGPLSNHSQFGDVEAGFKVALLSSETRYLTLQARAYFPTGDARQGLGTAHYSLEPSLLYHQSLLAGKFEDRWTLSAQFGGWHPIHGSAGVSPLFPQSFAGDVLIYGLGTGYDVVSKASYRFTPVVEFVGWSVLSGLVTVTPSAAGATASTAGVNIANIKIGARTTIRDHHSIYVGYGHALTSTTWYENLLRLEYRYVF